MLDKLKEIGGEALQNIEAAATLEALEKVRLSFLGKRGALSEVLKGLGTASPEERPKVGSVANDWKRKIEHALEERKNALEKVLLAEKLRTESIDITEPSRLPHQGVHHI